MAKNSKITLSAKDILPEDIKISFGSYMNEAFDYIKKLDDVTHRSEPDQDEQIIIVKANLHEALLDLGTDLLDRGKHELYPYAAIIAGYVASSHYSELHAKKIDRLLDKLEAKFNQLRGVTSDDQLAPIGFQKEELPVTPVDSLEFEAYYCAGRMVLFESHFSQKLQGRAYEIMTNTLFKDASTYARV